MEGRQQPESEGSTCFMRATLYCGDHHVCVLSDRWLLLLLHCTLDHYLSAYILRRDT